MALFIIPTHNTPYLVFLLTVISPSQSLSQVLDFSISSFFLISPSTCDHLNPTVLPNNISHSPLCKHWHILTLSINISRVHYCKILQTGCWSSILLLQECTLKTGLFDLSSFYSNNLKIFFLLSELSYLNIYSFQCCILNAYYTTWHI